MLETEKPTPVSNKLRILISGSLPPPLSGLEIYFQTLLNSSLPEQVDLSFVQTSAQKRKLSSAGKATISNMVYAILDCGRFTWAILTKRPQIAHIGNAAGLSYVKHSVCVIIARIFGSRVLLHPHCSLLVLYDERSKSWQWFFKRVIRWTNGVLVLSKEWLRLRSIVPGCKVYYLPNAIDLTQFRPMAEKHLAESKLGIPCKILYLGWLGKAKGCFDLVDAALEAHSQGIDMIVDLVGGELVSGELELLRKKINAAKLEDYVRLHPLAYGKEKLDFLQDADIFVYPSYAEGMPMAVLEAMACGLPIVASRVGGIPDLIQDGKNGILVEPGRPEQLAGAICRIARDHELRNSMKKANYQQACEQYDIEQHVKQLVQLYQNLVYG